MSDKAKSFDFNAGFVYAKIEKYMYDHFVQLKKGVPHQMDIKVPKVWFNLQFSTSTKVTLTSEQIKALRQQIERAAEAHWLAFDTSVSVYPYEQYMNFSVHIQKKEPKPKELTVSQIETLLGHKIKIVAEESAE